MELPFYIEENRVGSETRYTVRPLFFGALPRQSPLLSRALHGAVEEVRDMFAQRAEGPRHDEILPWTFAPDVTTEILTANLLLRHTSVHCRLMLAEFPAPGEEKRRLAFSPAIPDLWFDLDPGESLLTRAAEVLTDHFKTLEKELGAHFRPPVMTEFTRGWVTTADVRFTPHQKCAPPASSLMAALMGEEKMSGQKELRRVARRIDELYPDELDRAILRDPEVAELTRVMEGDDRRPALLVGPPLAGKTAVVHEYIFRRRTQIGPTDYRGSLWLLAPQRLISGMMYAGQWESRLLAILDHLKETRQVLYLDDLPGFFHAGISAQSKLNAAQVLRPYIERRDVRVLAEITLESLRILQERDRAFADLFHIIPVREPPEPDARRILLSVVRQLESLHRCRFAVDVLPTVLELQNRYVRDRALPGKAALFLKNLAAKFARRDVARKDVLKEFHAKSGLAVGFLDRAATLRRTDVENALRQNIIAQEPALSAMTDIVAIAKAQLNDPGKPLGSLLFLGPTGVGKTQAAKALALYLYGDADRLLRFDMNEFLDAWSAQRLVGGWDQPDGLLTSAVRRRPFGVILLDEIEKAHPAVFDLLLQVLGEGRLTDALGRTSDFTNTIIIMTSNLGVRDADQNFGFATGNPEDRAAVFHRAAQAFFRPEFYNRIDRVIPFDRLSRAQTRRIADDLIANVLQRQGLRQRQCMLSVNPAAMERIVDAGYHPELGARALKRAIEHQVTQPVAAQLAALEPGTPTLINVFPQGAGIGVQVRALDYAQRQSPLAVSDPNDTIAAVDAALDRLHAALQKLRPAGRLTLGAIPAPHLRYFAMKDQFDRIERLLEHFERRQKRAATAAAAPQKRAAVKPPKGFLRRSRVHFRASLAALDLRQHLHELVENPAPAASQNEETLLEILRQLALLEAMDKSTTSRLVLLLRVLSGTIADAAPVIQFYNRLDWNLRDITPQLLARRPAAASHTFSVLVEHPAADVLAQTERGVHLVIGPAQLHPVQIIPMPLHEADDPIEKITPLLAAHDAWHDHLARGKAQPHDDPLPPGNILRIFDRNILDLRTGFLTPARAPAAEAKIQNLAMLLAALPLPPELEAT